jgi:ribosomal protein S18 acetylase RimI-like enzyme
MNKDILIRQMVPEDFSDCTLIMSFAFRSKLPALAKFSAEEVGDFMLAGGLFYEKDLDGYYVADVDGKAVGVMHLESCESPKKAKHHPIKRKYMTKKYGFFRCVFSGIGMFLLKSRVSKGDMMVDFIAVHPSLRGKGIGGRLLDFGENKASQAIGISRYTLGVIEKNVYARRLYERKGFKVVKSKKRWLSRLFTGISKYHIMAKPLKADTVK